MYTTDAIRQLCDYYGLTMPETHLESMYAMYKTPSVGTNSGTSLHAILDMLDKAADLDTTGFFKTPHLGAYTVGIRIRMHEQHIQKPCMSYFWLGAEGTSYVAEVL